MSEIYDPITKKVEEAYDSFNDNKIIDFKKKIAILTCMDPRIVPDSLNDSPDAYIIRNAGGRASDDAIRSLVVSHKLLGTNEWFVIHHTDCGMQKFDNQVMGCLLKHSLEPATLVKNCNVTLEPVESVCECLWKDTGICPGSIVGKYIDWLPILHGLFDSVLEDVAINRNHPLVPSNIPIYGYIYDVVTQKLIPVPKAIDIGRAEQLKCCKKNNHEKFCKCCRK